MTLLARLLLLATLALPALLFEPQAQHAFWSAELLSLRLLAPLALIAALAAPLQAPALPKQVKLWGSLLGAAWILSALFSQRWDLAAAELMPWLAYPMVFMAAWRLSGSKQERHKLLFFILLIGLAQALYGLLQAAGQDPFPWATLFGGRAGGFLGNPNFLGGHLALLIPLSLGCCLAWGGKQWLAAALLLAGLIATQTRGAWIGAVLGCAITLWLCQGQAIKRRKAVAALAGCAVLAAGLFWALNPGSFKRLLGGEELSKRSVLMQATAKMALEYPVLGIGPGNFRIGFPTVQAVGLRSETLHTRPYVYSEHAHNDFLQMAADAGFPALLAYALLLLALAKALFLGLRSSKEPLLLAGLIGGLAALQVHGLANFPFLIGPTQATAWALAAIGLRLSAGEAAQAGYKISFSSASLLLALAFAAAVYWGRLFAQDKLWWVGEGEVKLGNYGKGSSIVSKALELNPKEDRLWRQLGIAQNLNGPSPLSLGSYKEALRLNPNFTEAGWELGKAYLRLGMPGDAEAVLLSTAKNAPNLAELWEPLGVAFFMQKKYSEALGAFQMSERLAPGQAAIQVNMAVTQLHLGDKVAARASLEKARSLDPGNAQAKELMKALR